ncbi:twin transmembrane helix small protein [Pigmentiphaga soli]|uniref:Twin transmembrane helix small protein n=1 Tax=Pigmentiphaga soli TaxID=1007095 RepID=A0ABP8GI80_9BURK
MRIIVALAFLGILGSLGSALVFMMKDKSKTNRTVNALTARIGLSVVLFLFVLFAHWMGWIDSTGIR